MASHDVFISYPSADKAAADGVCHGLEARGVRCWMAPRDVIPGSDWQTSLLDAIADAKVVVLLFTENANSSEHIKREITAAFEGGAVVIPFRLENVTPKGALRYHLTGVHWLDAFAGEMTPHVEQLAQTIKRVLQQGQAGAAAPLVAAAPEEPAAATQNPAPSSILGAEAAAAPTSAAAAFSAGAGRTEAALSTPPAPASSGEASPPTQTPGGIAPPPPRAAAPAAPRPDLGPAAGPASPGGQAGGVAAMAESKPWLVWAAAGGVAAVLLGGAIVFAMSRSGNETPPATASGSASGVQIDLNSRPTPPPGAPLQTLPDQPSQSPPPQLATDPAPQEPLTEAPPEEPIYPETAPGEEPAPYEGAKPE